MNIMIIDFETRSLIDLPTRGTDIYCKNPSTEILTLAAVMFDPDDDYRYVYEPVRSPRPVLLDAELQDFFVKVRKHVASGGLIAAQNARFDQQIWEYVACNDYDFPMVPAEQWVCSSAQARINAMPANLDDATRAAGTRHKKDHRGAQLIKLLSIPRDDGTFCDDADLLTEMAQYCLDDALATKDLMHKCRMLTPTEHEDWLTNERINDRGIKVDLELANFASQYAAAETVEIGAELDSLTRGVVTKHTQNQRIKKWVLSTNPPDAVGQLMTVYKKGVKKYSLASDIRTQILDRADAGEIDLDDKVYNVIAALDEGSKSSVSKFRTMAARAEDDGRVRGSLIYAGASTIRYTSRGLQLHNFKRDCLSTADTDTLVSMMRSGGQLAGGSVMKTLTRALRPSLIPEKGNSLVVGDWKSVENRALPWLADSPGADKKLDVFNRIDRDPSLPDTYMLAAADAGVTDRQVGKVIELSMGFGGAEGAFMSMARNYGVYLPKAQVTLIVKAWRAANPWAEAFWNGLEKAARAAIRNPGYVAECGRVKYLYVPSLVNGSLVCEVPGGQMITYPDTRIAVVETQWGPKTQITALKASWKPAADATEWPRYGLWRGLLAENVTQAVCASLLRWAVRRMESRFHNVVLHCHDEIALECPTHQAQAMRKELEKTMGAGPVWAAGLPLKAPCSIMTRYGQK